MKRISLASLVCATALAVSPAAFAQSFNFSYSDPSQSVNANGTLTGTEIGNTGEYDITSGIITISISGTVYATGVLDPNTADDGGGWDNLLYTLDNAPGRPGPSYLTSLGILFSATSGYAGLWNGDNNGNGTAYSLQLNSAPDIAFPGTFTISAPEGGTTLLYLLLAGGACFGAMFLVSRSRCANVIAA